MYIDVNIGAHQQPLKLQMYPPLRPEEQVYGGEEEEDGDTGTHPIIITARNKLERWRPETFAHWPIIIFKFDGWLGVAGDTCHHQLGGLETRVIRWTWRGHVSSDMGEMWTHMTEVNAQAEVALLSSRHVLLGQDISSISMGAGWRVHVVPTPRHI